MVWQKEPCPRCGEPKVVIAKFCRKCVTETSDKPVCPQCGGKKYYSSKLCRPCKDKQATYWHPCPDCGKTIQQGSTRCLDCYNTARQHRQPNCVDCGNPTKRYAATRAAKRCWACEMQRRRDRPKKPCSVDGCPRPHQAKGFCMVHYVQSYRPRPTGQFRGNRLRKILAFWPCQLCGYAGMPSDIHRLFPGAQGGLYTPGNMVALCVRCHREVHRGISHPPVAPTEEEIRATAPVD